MPCFIGIIQFLRCRHCLLFKLGCTNNCEELCPTEKQVPLVATNYLWLCEDCHERKANVNLDDRCNEWADLMMDIPKGDAQLHSMMENAIRSREKADDVACEKSRVQCNEEIQWVAEWTLEYGLMIYDVLFKQMWEPQRAAERIQQLRGLRVWDLLVVKDALRGPKVLFEEQWNETYWFISGEYDNQCCQNDVTDRLCQTNSLSNTCYVSNSKNLLLGRGRRFLCFLGRKMKTRDNQERAP
ncbi:unnamed protein product [Fusarium graminearum]|uniref:Uncharacterized protein n=1 Tax=Gibberella zeae (strain ATCC MYA-4620 / CBS 123657 / FGSC 9075 / NRRL 31084 / PH-1) TaxID=229533 RepID=A0A098E5F2_GIBZE|nr:unnamed protein product [Fusarium graminearum]